MRSRFAPLYELISVTERLLRKQLKSKLETRSILGSQYLRVKISIVQSSGRFLEKTIAYFIIFMQLDTNNKHY